MRTPTSAVALTLWASVFLAQCPLLHAQMVITPGMPPPYVANDSITTNGTVTINSGQTVSYQSGRIIDLKPGAGTICFHAAAGSSFHAFISPPDFVISVAPTAGSSAVLAGMAIQYTVTVTSMFGFSGTVTFSSSVSGLPSGTSASFIAQSVAPPVNGSASTTLSISTKGTDAGGVTGNYDFTFTGTSGSRAHTGAASVSIQDFVLQFSPSSISVARPTTGTTAVSYTIMATGVNGFSGTIGLKFDWPQSYPPSSSLSGTPISITPGSSATLTFILYGGNSPPSTTNFYITGYISGISHTKLAALTITSTPDFSVSITPSVQTVTLPATTSPTFSISVSPSGGFNGPVTFTASSSPPGVTASFSPASISGYGSTNMTITTPAGTAATFTVTVTAASGGVSHQGQTLLIVQDSNSQLPTPTESALLSMFVERHQWLVNSGAGASLYDIPDNDSATVSSMVASTKQQLDQLQSQAPTYTDGQAYATARSNILLGFKSQLIGGLASPSSWPTLDNYMNSVILPSISFTPLTTGGANDCTPTSGHCPSGCTCNFSRSEINFYNPGLDGRVDSWTEGPAAINFCAIVSQSKATYIAADGSTTNIVLPGSYQNGGNVTSCQGGRAWIGFTLEAKDNPKSGTYTIETYHQFQDKTDSIYYPPFPDQGFTPGDPPPAPATRSFTQTNGYDIYQTPVGLSLQVAGAKQDQNGDMLVTNCSAPILVTALFTPPIPSYNPPPKLTWTGGVPVDNLHVTVPCTSATTILKAALGSYLVAQVQIIVQVLTITGLTTTPSPLQVGTSNVSFHITGNNFGAAAPSVTAPCIANIVLQSYDNQGIIGTFDIPGTVSAGPCTITVTPNGQSQSAQYAITLVPGSPIISTGNPGIWWLGSASFNDNCRSDERLLL